jgi:outer membrane protein assembly factor BamB
LSSGARLWSREVPVLDQYRCRTDEERLYFGNATELQALDWRTGKPVWTTPTDGGIRYQDLRIAGESVVYSGANRVAALDRRTGKQRWEYRPRSVFESRLLGESEGRVYVGHEGTPRLLVLDAATGQVRSQGAFNSSEAADYGQGFVLYSRRHRLFFSTASVTSMGVEKCGLSAVSPDYRLRWHRSATSSGVLAGDVLVCPALTQGAYNRPDGLVGLRPADGRVLWRQGAGTRSYEWILGSSGSAIVVSTIRPPGETQSTALRALRAADGREIWRIPFSSNPLASGLYGQWLLAALPEEGTSPPTLCAYRLPPATSKP